MCSGLFSCLIIRLKHQNMQRIVRLSDSWLTVSTESNRSKYNCVSVSEPHRKGGRLCSQIGSREASRLFASYFLFPVCSHFLSCPSPPSVMCWLPESQPQSQETPLESNVCMFPRGKVFCLPNDIEKCAANKQIIPLPRISDRSLLINFSSLYIISASHGMAKYSMNVGMWMKELVSLSELSLCCCLLMFVFQVHGQVWKKYWSSFAFFFFFFHYNFPV